MLSGCIPVYNYNTTLLVEELFGQLREVNIPFEIVVIDDGSKKKYRKLNERSLKNASYVQIENNIDRAKIRNKFLEVAQYDSLLFIDSDSRICSPDYIKNYLEKI